MLANGSKHEKLFESKQDMKRDVESPPMSKFSTMTNGGEGVGEGRGQKSRRKQDATFLQIPETGGNADHDGDFRNGLAETEDVTTMRCDRMLIL
jgi:hypothetical protein